MTEHIDWRLQPRKIKDLKPHPDNPRELTKDDYAQLSKNIDKFGLIDKPIINTDNVIIGGHQRVSVLKKAGCKEVICWVPERDLSEEEHRELMIVLNKAQGRWDWDLLGDRFDIPELQEYGFTDEELGLGKDELDIDLDEDGSEAPGKKIVIMECPECKAHFEKSQAKVIDKGD